MGAIHDGAFCPAALSREARSEACALEGFIAISLTLPSHGGVEDDVVECYSHLP